jgi:hypothetical protein
MVSIEPSKDFVQQLEHSGGAGSSLDEDIIRLSGLSGAAEALFSGGDRRHRPPCQPSCIDGSLDMLREGFETTGLRGILCYETTDRNGLEGAAAGIRENERFALALDKEKKNCQKTGKPEPL